MKIQINGQEKEVSASTVAELVEQLGFKGDRLAIELNRDIVPRAKWAETPLHEGDRLEMVHFVGGGRLNVAPASRRLLRGRLDRAYRNVVQVAASLLIGTAVAAVTLIIVWQLGVIQNGGIEALSTNGAAAGALGALALVLAGSAGLVTFIGIIVWFSFKNRAKLRNSPTRA